MKAKESDRKFDEESDVSDQLDQSRARRPQRDHKRVNVDFPAWMIQALDREARHVGVTRQSIIKIWLAERLQRDSSNDEGAAESGR